MSSGKSLALQAILATTVFVSLFFAITLFVMLLAIARYTNSFSSATGIQTSQLVATISDGLSTTPINQDGSKTFLILGTDAAANRADQPLLTDTMLYAKVNFETGKIYLLSLPRDLWSEAYKTKVNALYHYSVERNEQAPFEFLHQSLFEVTGITPQHTIIISPDEIAQLVDTVDGIAVDVPTAFSDAQYPRDDVSLTSTDPAELYTTVSFEQGVEVMDGTRAIAYMRSRHSDDESGTDLSRNERQRNVLVSLAKKITSPEIILNPQKTAELFLFYSDYFADSITLEDSIASLRLLTPHRQSLEVIEVALPIESAAEGTSGVITNPPTSETNGQWVYTIVDDAEFQAFIEQNFNEK